MLAVLILQDDNQQKKLNHKIIAGKIDTVFIEDTAYVVKCEVMGKYESKKEDDFVPDKY